MAEKQGTMSSLEQGLTELESLVLKLEGGQMSIDEAIESYSKGMKLAASCKKALDEMVQKVTIARDEARRAMEESGSGSASPRSESVATDVAEEELPF